MELGLGAFPAVGLAAAREIAREYAALRAQGGDPRVQRKVAGEIESVPTFGEIAIWLIETKEGGWKNAKHRQQWRNTLTTYGAPIWDKPVDAVVVDDVLNILSPIWQSKHETATKVRGRIESVLDAAKVRGLRSGENPAAWRGNLALVLPPQRKAPERHHPAMPYEDVPAFMQELRANNCTSARSLELLIHTACRTSEVLDARWDEFDLAEAIWTIPASRMKAGKVHRIPLTTPMVRLLESLPRVGEFVFPGLVRGRPLSNMAMAQLLKRMKRLGITVHGFRSSFRDYAGDVAQVPREIAEQALAHQVGSDVERAYRRSDALKLRRELMEQWSAYLDPQGADGELPRP